MNAKFMQELSELFDTFGKRDPARPKDSGIREGLIRGPAARLRVAGRWTALFNW
jgi:hypothetical protein